MEIIMNNSTCEKKNGTNKHWIILMVLMLVFFSCKSKKVEVTPQNSGSDKELYERAKSRIKKNPEKARLMFKEVIHLYPDSVYARRAKIGIADSYFKQKGSAALIMAATEYQEFVNLYPRSPDAVYAKLQVGICYYRQIRKPGRDQDNTHQAVKALQSMVKMFPDVEEAKEAKKMIAKARINLAKHYFSIGISNYRIKAFKGAINRFKQVIDDYPEFAKKDKLYYYTGRSYLATRDYDSALSFFQRIITSFPKSKYLKKASKKIKKINAVKASQNVVKK
jgi:outer membrane protein assembly factor BamD